MESEPRAPGEPRSEGRGAWDGQSGGGRPEVRGQWQARRARPSGRGGWRRLALVRAARLLWLAARTRRRIAWLPPSSRPAAIATVRLARSLARLSLDLSRLVAGVRAARPEARPAPPRGPATSARLEVAAPPAAPAASPRPGAGLGDLSRGVGAWATGVVRRMPAPLATLFFVAPTRRRAATELPRVVSPARPPQARIIANPVSGAAAHPLWRADLEETAAWLTEHGLPTELCLTDRPGGARQLAEEAVRGRLRTVVAAGGDGTINEVVQALAGHTTALGVLPLGTVNVWAREINLPHTLAEARTVILHGQRRRIDLGRANTRYFLLMAGVGIDAEATRRVQQHYLALRGLKLLDYAVTGGLLSFTQRPARLRVEREGRRRHLEAVQIVIGNTRLYGGAFAFTQRALADDGQLDVVYVGGRRLRHRAQVLLRAALRRRSLGVHALYDRVRAVRIESDAPLPVHVDGELAGFLPMTFTACPRMLTVIVPPAAPTDLFQHPPLAD
jgi:YegS/Rv2252/BmrU family lipid kinase